MPNSAYPVLRGRDYHQLHAELADMETFAVVRVCERFGLPLMGLRGVSDGPTGNGSVRDWEAPLELLDSRLAEAIDLIPAVLRRLPQAIRIAEDSIACLQNERPLRSDRHFHERGFDE